jgi:hypothetical protein
MYVLEKALEFVCMVILAWLTLGAIYEKEHRPKPGWTEISEGCYVYRGCSRD